MKMLQIKLADVVDVVDVVDVPDVLDVLDVLELVSESVSVFVLDPVDNVVVVRFAPAEPLRPWRWTEAGAGAMDP